MTSLTGRATRSGDLCHDPHRIEKCNGKGHFPSHCFEPFKNSQKSPQERKKRETRPFVRLPPIQKHNRVKSVVNSGGGPRQQRAFFTTAKPKRDHCPLPVSPTPTMGSPHHSRCKPKRMVCDDEVKDTKSDSISPPTPQR